LYNFQILKNTHNECEKTFFLVANQFVTNVQLKILTHMFYPWISSHKLYKEGVFFLCVHIKIHVSIWDEIKKLNLKMKHKIKNIYLHGYYLTCLLR